LAESDLSDVVAHGQPPMSRHSSRLSGSKAVTSSLMMRRPRRKIRTARSPSATGNPSRSSMALSYGAHDGQPLALASSSQTTARGASHRA
jgi:hypothetical protein